MSNTTTEAIENVMTVWDFARPDAKLHLMIFLKHLPGRNSAPPKNPGAARFISILRTVNMNPLETDELWFSDLANLESAVRHALTAHRGPSSFRLYAIALPDVDKALRKIEADFAGRLDFPFRLAVEPTSATCNLMEG